MMWPSIGCGRCAPATRPSEQMPRAETCPVPWYRRLIMCSAPGKFPFFLILLLCVCPSVVPVVAQEDADEESPFRPGLVAHYAAGEVTAERIGASIAFDLREGAPE